MTEVTFGPRDRRGPKAPTASTPPRAPGSVRRTTTLDGLHPDGPGGPTQLVLRARDLRTELHGSATELGHAEVRMRVEPGGSVLEVGADPPEPRLVVRQEPEDDEDAQERLNARIAETHRRTTLTITDHRCTDLGEGLVSDVAVRARSLDVE